MSDSAVTTDPIIYDFKSPGGLASDTGQQLKHWMNSFRNLFREKWSAIVPSELDVQLENDTAFSFAVLKGRMPNPGLGFNVAFAEDQYESLIVMERKAALAIVMEMTGDSSQLLQDGETDGGELEDRELSTVEFSLFEMFIREMVSSLSESWVDQQSLFMECRGCEEMPHRSRLYGPKTLMLSLNFTVRLGNHQFGLHWYVPQGAFNDLLSESNFLVSEQQAESREALIQHANEMKVKLSVFLGNAELSVAQIEQLSAGDVIVFDQKITDPLAVTIEEQHKFKAWPGRHGNNQAIKISENLS